MEMPKLTKRQEAFAWRVWNTFKSTVLPISAMIILARLNDTPNSLDVLLTKSLWESVGFAVIVSLLSGVIAGADKVKRMPKN